MTRKIPSHFGKRKKRHFEKDMILRIRKASLRIELESAARAEDRGNLDLAQRHIDTALKFEEEIKQLEEDNE